MNYKSTALWKKCFSEDSYSANAKERDYFSYALDRFHENAEQLVAQIPIDLKDFTVHDITHLDALWETASTIIGEDYPPLNPAEGFVLGGAILLHDAGMCFAAYPEGIDAVRETVQWRDALGRIYRSAGKDPPPTPPFDTNIQRAADLEALRVLHAQQAEKLPESSWNGRKLIELDNLREHYGQLIGKLARSHWNNTYDLPNEFNFIHSSIALRNKDLDIPSQWTVDALKIACILRVADAAHIDARRAPPLMLEFVKPTGISLDHWRFQSRIGQPWADGDGLTYKSNRPFEEEESDAWWVCFDTVQMIDNELKSVDAVLSNYSRKSRNRFLCKRVNGASRPEELAKFIESKNWYPVDTRLKVTDVPHLARTLGGKQLYGNQWIFAPLRELMQNSADAIRARRLLSNGGLSDSEGRITVRLVQQNDTYYIEVDDNGVGMSPLVMTGPLIDFGKSFWQTNLLEKEFPGLSSTSFKSIAKYGIGFFSAFMWGDQVTITSRRYDKALNECWSLVFKGGVQSRPILKPTPSAIPPNVSTRIQIKLNFNPHAVMREFDDMLGLLSFRKQPLFSSQKKEDLEIKKMELENLAKGIAPLLDIDVYAETNLKAERAITANDWKSMNTEEYLKRYNYSCLILGLPSDLTKDEMIDDIKHASSVIDSITETDKQIARIFLSNNHEDHPIYCGQGFSIGSLKSNFSGFVSGAGTLTASRNQVFNTDKFTPPHAWYKQQANLLKTKLKTQKLKRGATIIIAWKLLSNGVVPPKQCDFIYDPYDNYLSLEEFQSKLKIFDEIAVIGYTDNLYDDADDCSARDFENNIKFNDNVFLLPRGIGRSFRDEDHQHIGKIIRKEWKKFEVEEMDVEVAQVSYTEISRSALVYRKK